MVIIYFRNLSGRLQLRNINYALFNTLLDFIPTNLNQPNFILKSLHRTGDAMDIEGNIDNEIDSTKKVPIPQSLRVSAKDVSDYYTKAEYTAFMKPKSGKEKKLRRKKKEVEEVEADPLEAVEDFSASNEGEEMSLLYCGVCFVLFSCFFVCFIVCLVVCLFLHMIISCFILY